MLHLPVLSSHPILVNWTQRIEDSAFNSYDVGEDRDLSSQRMPEPMSIWRYSLHRWKDASNRNIHVCRVGFDGSIDE